MKRLIISAFCSFFILSMNAQTSTLRSTPDPKKKVQVVEASCGECQFHLPGKGCELAVRIDGKAYFVDGTSIDEHGDAHANDGFCEAVKKAEAQGEIVNNRFKATYFKIIKPEAKKAAPAKRG